VSDATLRSRRDEWATSGVFDAARDEAMAAHDRIIGLDLSEVALGGPIHKTPCGGEVTGRSPVDRAKLRRKWSIATDANGEPIRIQSLACPDGRRKRCAIESGP